jgi:hypothetical protein
MEKQLKSRLIALFQGCLPGKVLISGMFIISFHDSFYHGLWQNQRGRGALESDKAPMLLCVKCNEVIRRING